MFVRLFCLFRLVLDPLDAGADGLLVAQIPSLEGFDRSVLRDGLEVLVQFVDERGAGGDVELGDLRLVDPVQMLHEGPQGVSVGGDQNGLAGFELRGDVGVPEGNDAVEGGREGLGEILGPFRVLVPLVVGGVVLVRGVDGRRGDVVAAAPHQDLVLPVLVDGLLLVESLESSVVALVDLPRLDGGDPHAVRLFQDVPQGSDGPLLQGGEGDIGLDVRLLDELSALLGLDVAGLAQRAIVPAGELIREIPRRFSVSDQDQRVLVGLLRGGEAADRFSKAKRKPSFRRTKKRPT